jgi:CheY-like chemotaxis protein
VSIAAASIIDPPAMNTDGNPKLVNSNAQTVGGPTCETSRKRTNTVVTSGRSCARTARRNSRFPAPSMISDPEAAHRRRQRSRCRSLAQRQALRPAPSRWETTVLPASPKARRSRTTGIRQSSDLLHPPCGVSISISRPLFHCRTPHHRSLTKLARCPGREAGILKGHPREGKAIPARVIVVHDEPSFLDPLVASLKAAGHEVAAFPDPTSAWNAIRFSNEVQILVTRVQFGEGKPHGVTLARWARERFPAVGILFVALPEFQDDVEDLGVLLSRPVSVPEVAEAVGHLLSNERLGRGHGPADRPR